jgi:hypothetical protein
MFRLKALLVLALFGLTSLSAQDVLLSPAILEWQDVSTRYRGFDEIKPVLVNRGKQSVFLSRIWPHGSGQLERLNESTGNWEAGDWRGGCGSVSKPTIPIEVKPGAERLIRVYWQLSTDDWDKPKHFVVGGSREERSIEGKYRFELRYSLTPWTLVHHPVTIYTILSPEFFLIQ